jgi:hypothetical protein
MEIKDFKGSRTTLDMLDQHAPLKERLSTVVCTLKKNYLMLFSACPTHPTLELLLLIKNGTRPLSAVKPIVSQVPVRHLSFTCTIEQC